MNFCPNCGYKFSNENHSFCPNCGASLVAHNSEISTKQETKALKPGDYGNVLLHGDGAGNAVITTEIILILVFQVGFSIYAILFLDYLWATIMGVVFLSQEAIQLYNTFIAAKATEITIYEYGVKGVSLDRSKGINHFWSIFYNKDFQCSYDKITSVSKDKEKFVLIKDSYGRENRFPAQNASIICDAISKRLKQASPVAYPLHMY